MRYIILFLSFVLASAFYQCAPEPDSTPEITELLPRSEAIRYGKEWEDAQNFYQRNKLALQADPSAVAPRLQLAELFANEARITGEHGHYYPAALDLARQVISLDNANPDEKFQAMVLKASLELSLHQFEEALRTGEAALAMNPHFAGTYGVLVDACVELGQYSRAVEMADKMAAIRPDLRSYSRVSYLREIHGMVEPAIEAMEEAVKAGVPGSEQKAWARLTLGNLYRQYGWAEKAAIQYEMILAERPGYPFALEAMAEMELQQGRPEEAEKLLMQATEAIPEVGFYITLASIYQQSGREEAFKKTWEEILTMLQDDTRSGHLMDMEYAQVYRDLALDYDTALIYALKEYNRRPDNIDVNRLLASIYYKKGDMVKSNFHHEKAVATGSKHPELQGLASM